MNYFLVHNSVNCYKSSKCTFAGYSMWTVLWPGFLPSSGSDLILTFGEMIIMIRGWWLAGTLQTVHATHLDVINAGVMITRAKNRPEPTCYKLSLGAALTLG